MFNLFCFRFRDFGSPIDDVFRTFERHMDEMFGSFGFDFSVGRLPPSSFGFGVVDGPEINPVEDEPHNGGSLDNGRQESGKRILSLRDEMLKAPGARKWPVTRYEAGAFGVGEGDEPARRDSDLDNRIKSGGLDAILNEVCVTHDLFKVSCW